MEKYICIDCGETQYTADSHSTTPCIYCGGRVIRADSEEAIELELYNVQEGMRAYFRKKEE